MGWNTSALFVKGEDGLALLEPHATATGQAVTGDVATSRFSNNVFYVAQSGQWQQIWDPSAAHVFNAKPGKDTLTAVFSSVTSTYGFILIEGGKLTRQVVFTDGELTIDEGLPLVFEATIPLPSWGPDEDWLWAIIEHVTGVTFDVDQSYAVYAYP